MPFQYCYGILLSEKEYFELAEQNLDISDEDSETITEYLEQLQWHAQDWDATVIVPAKSYNLKEWNILNDKIMTLKNNIDSQLLDLNGLEFKFGKSNPFYGMGNKTYYLVYMLSEPITAGIVSKEDIELKEYNEDELNNALSLVSDISPNLIVIETPNIAVGYEMWDVTL